MRESTASAIAFALLVAVSSSTAGTLVVRTQGYSDSLGGSVVQVFGQGASIAHGPVQSRVTAPIAGGKSLARIENLPAGKWAVMVFHDRNGNGTLDHGWNRLPQEAMGFSNGFVPTLLAGKPTWEKIAVDLAGPSDTLDLRIRPFTLTDPCRGDEK